MSTKNWQTCDLSFYDLTFTPGLQFELEDGSRFLVGDVNAEGGICDDCTLFDELRNTDRIDLRVVRVRNLLDPSWVA